MDDAVDALIDEFARRLSKQSVHFGHGADNARDEARLLIGGYLRRAGRASLTAEDVTALHHLLRRRIDERVPTAYLTGEGWFAGRRFEVVPGVMIPRSPIAELIEGSFAPWLRGPCSAILDLCCGSGCIGIAAALKFPGATLTLADIDGLALDTARRNVQIHGLTERTQIVQGSLFDCLDSARFDLIATNPPYVNRSDLAGMPAEHRHEPVGGLTGGRDGLDLWRQILRQVPHHLERSGLLVGEVGNSGPALQAAYALPFIWPELTRSARLEDGTFGVFVLDGDAFA